MTFALEISQYFQLQFSFLVIPKLDLKKNVWFIPFFVFWPKWPKTKKYQLSCLFIFCEKNPHFVWKWWLIFSFFWSGQKKRKTENGMNPKYEYKLGVVLPNRFQMGFSSLFHCVCLKFLTYFYDFCRCAISLIFWFWKLGKNVLTDQKMNFWLNLAIFFRRTFFVFFYISSFCTLFT